MDGVKKLWKPYFAVLLLSSLFYIDVYFALSDIPYGKDLFELRNYFRGNQPSNYNDALIVIIIFSLFSDLTSLKKIFSMILHIVLASVLQFLVIVYWEILLFPSSLT